MRLFILFSIFLTLLLAGAGAAAQDENMIDTLRIEKVKSENGGPVAVKVHFFNDEELAALTIPLTLNGSGYKIDSVSFDGSRIEYLNMKPVTIGDDSLSVVFGAIVMMEEYISPGNGLMGTIYLRPSNPKAGTSCAIDTTTIGPATVLFTLPSSESFIPAFVDGQIDIGDSAKTR